MWEELAQRGLTVRPWEGTKPRAKMHYSPFRAGLRQTFATLSRELRALDAKQIIVELDIRERDIRQDGYPRADARPGSPIIAVSFSSKHGPLRYVCAEYSDWRDNLRAIALGLEALRAVDRYGISRRGEQYRGYRELPMSTGDPAANMTEEQAEEFLARWGGDVTAALKATHPDHGGDPNDFRKVQRARELMAGAA